MNLTSYIESLHRELMTAAEMGGDEARAIAQRLIAPLESASRLVLLEVLSDAANEITREIAPGSVDLRLRGRDPEFVVTQPAPPDSFEGSGEVPTTETPSPVGDTGDGGTSRMTLRLPEQLKLRIEEAAARDRLSVNAWLVRALSASLEPGDERRTRRRSPPGGQRYTGWVR
ncbi:MAG TPA: toxin-antitoxin system HicB family antitoxin [Actinomycetota bacterium]|jgi:hypothetical protein|nr:toxin-antitoxin system HicB family antitoxin [Actinomycetota bacterium]